MPTGRPEPRTTSPSKKNSLLRSSLIVSIMTLFSRVLGLVRDVVFAQYMGAGSSADAFLVAFKIPNFLRRLFAEGAFSQAFVPVLSEYQQNKSFQDVKLLIASAAGVLSSILLVVTFVAILGSPILAGIFAPGFLREDPEKFKTTSELLRITFPYLLFISLAALSSAVLNVHQRFGVPAATPVILNICLIASVFLAVDLGFSVTYSVAVGVFIAGALQLSFQLPFLASLGLLAWPRMNFQHPGVKRIMQLMLPALLGVSVSQINLLLDTVLASFLQDGSVAWLYFSDRLAELPMGLFGIAIATVILPKLSQQHSADSPQAFAATLDWALRMVLLLGLPATIALIVLAEPLLMTLFFYGEMTRFDISMAAMSLRAYGLGLLAFMWVKVLAPGFFARQDMKRPVKIAMYAMLANMILNLLLVWPLQHAGLALATSLSSLLNAYWLYQSLRKEGIYEAQQGWRRILVVSALANGLLCSVLWFAVPEADYWADSSLLGRVSMMTGVVLLGVVGYVVSLLVLGIRPRHLRQQG